MSHIWTFCGTVSLLIGIIGILLPLLPTTPFLLLAAYCYARGSPKLFHWLLQHRWLGGYIRDWREGRGIPLKSKVLAIALIALTIGCSVLSIELHLAVKLLLVCLAVLVSFYILTRPTR